MKPLLTQRWSSLAVVTALAVVLIMLGVMQYHWSRIVSDAAGVRMQMNLHASLLGWRQDFYRELGSASDALQGGHGVAPERSASAIAERYTIWRRTAAHPELIAGVFLVQGPASNTGLSRLDPATGQFVATGWPRGFEQLRDWLQHASAGPSTAGAPRNMTFHVEAPPGSGRPGLNHRSLHLGPMPWLVAQDVPALVSPLMHAPEMHREDRPVEWLIVLLDSGVLRDSIFPELAERYFGGHSALGYRVDIVSGSERVYSSDRAAVADPTAGADAVINVFGPPLAMASTGGNTFAPPIPMRGEGGTHLVHLAGAAPSFHFEPIRYSAPSSDWRLAVRNRSGSLEAVATAIRRRNLAISFGVLLVLAATVGMILVASQRAQRLAKLQMEFVAAVSHELRTPLTVISSAADNIVDGVVYDKQQVRRYGAVIKNQARQLIHIVEQVLLFAATRDSAHRYHVQSLAVADIVDAALESTAELVSAAGFKVERAVAPGLPPVAGDMVALTQCLQNLIVNAVKYGGEQRWIGVQADLATAAGRDEVRISVADRGPGIPTSEVEQIFQPFYRSTSATAAQIHGTGLGLPLARRIAEAMNGSISVSSEPGKGSTFVLHLPAAATGQAEILQPASAGEKVS
jgi:two-component system, OmpR family, sensor histidine kinase SenX3